MPLYLLFLLAAIQGLTEFLPVSSSAHLALFPALTGAQDQGQIIDVAVHIGTLGAVIVYFWTDVKRAISGGLALLRGRFSTPDAQLAILLVIATIPVVLLGLVLHLTGWSEYLRSIKVIAWAMIGFGLLLYVFDQRAAQTKSDAKWSIADAAKLGIWQAVALIPGASRSGMVITGGLQLGYSRIAAAKIAMLMSIPTIIASAILLGGDAVARADYEALKAGAIAALLAFGTGLLALRVMLLLLKSISYTPYVIYRVVLGLILLWVAYA